MLSLFGFVGYLIAALLFFALAALLVKEQRRVRQTGWLVAAATVSCIWALMNAVEIRYATLSPGVIFFVEVLRSAAWLAFLVSVLNLAGSRLLSPTIKYAAYVGPIVLFLLGSGLFDVPASVNVTGSIALAILALVILERIYFNADPAARRSVGYLSVAIAGLFGYDLILYSSSVLLGHVGPGMWAARGAVNAAVVPLLIVAARQNRDWRVDMFVSRQVAYFSLTMTGAGIYLILVALGGYYVNAFGGSLGGALAALVIFVSLLALAALLVSDKLRRLVRVFFSKHFFRNRYDYRDQWLKLSATLYDPADKRPLGERSIEAAARILNSHAGYLLLRREGPGSALLPSAAWRCDLPDQVIVLPDDPLVGYLETSNWIVDTKQFRDESDFYGELQLPDWLLTNTHQQFVVPLLQQTELIGLIVLDQENPAVLTFEDTDILKIVGRQIAGLLAQALDSERLAEGKQFQAYSRLTAFLMHDLKNIAAQLSLIVKNAVQHRQNPDFVDDAFETLEHSVTRMNRLIAQLAERDRKEKRRRVSVDRVIRDVIKQVSDRSPLPSYDGDVDGVDVSADQDKLTAIFTHVFRNAQDACAGDGSITVASETSPGYVRIRISDTGKGMDDTFIRERLFKPFESTKGVDGMGIGAYQAREYVRELNGSLDVASEPGQGTKVTISLPRTV